MQPVPRHSPNGSSMRLVACHLHTGGALPPELTVGAPS